MRRHPQRSCVLEGRTKESVPGTTLGPVGVLSEMLTTSSVTSLGSRASTVSTRVSAILCRRRDRA